MSMRNNHFVTRNVKDITYSQRKQTLNEPVISLHNYAKYIYAKGKDNVYPSLQGRKTMQIHDREQITLGKANKIMKTCISSPSQKLEKTNTRVSFYTDEIQKRINSPIKVNAKMERLTKSQSNIKPESQERLKKVHGRKSKSNKTIDLKFKRTSSLTTLEKVEKFKKMHKLYAEGGLDKEIITKEVISLIHAINQKSTDQKYNPKKSNEISVNIKRQGVIDRIRHRKILKTSEGKYDAVILNNICVMGKKLTLWKKIKQHFDSSTTTKTDEGSNETIVIESKQFKATEPKKTSKTNTQAFKPYSRSYFCYPVSCEPSKGKWNITTLQKHKPHYISSKERTPTGISSKREKTKCCDNPKCLLVNLAHTETKTSNRPLQQASICSYTVRDCRGCHKEDEPCVEKLEPVVNVCCGKKYDNNLITYCNKNVEFNLKNEVSFGDEDEMKTDGTNTNLYSFCKGLILQQGKQIANKVKNECKCFIPKKMVNERCKNCRNRSVRTQVTAKSCENLKVNCNRTLPHDIHKRNICESCLFIDKCDTKKIKQEKCQGFHQNIPGTMKHKGGFWDISGDGPRQINCKPEPKFICETPNNLRKKSKNRSSQTPKILFCDQCLGNTKSKLTSRRYQLKNKCKCKSHSYKKEKLTTPENKKPRLCHDIKNKKDTIKPKPTTKVISIKVKKKKKKKSKKRREFGCEELYMNSLGKRPCMCVYCMCPSCYPQCLSFLGLIRQSTRLCLFMLATCVWVPCLCSLELCRLFFCSCFSCK